MVQSNLIGHVSFGYQPLAPFASNAWKSRGRLIDEPSSPTRSAFQRDRDRIIHSNAFRRLKHKTQVFIAHEGDHTRTRLTHTIEVAQIARALARAFRLDEDLAEAIALVHDFGHTPFGHAGEDALNAAMLDVGGFDHNAQALRIVTKLERRYALFDGLNLSWETLEGLVKHNGPLIGPHARHGDLSHIIGDFDRQFPLDLDKFASMEAQCAAIADDIAYDAHDIDDGLRAGLLSLPELQHVSLPAKLIAEIDALYPGLDDERRGYELVRRQITQMVEDVIATSGQRLNAYKPQSIEDIYNAPQSMIGFSEKMAAQELELKAFLYKNLYHHPRVLERRTKAEQIVTRLFAFYVENPQKLPPEWARNQNQMDGTQSVFHIADFLSGMTDNYALRIYEDLFDEQVNLT